ncbi:MAG: twin-arginine translocase subunit TatC, partial [Muribaculaceae bacterium]|nr:twin-arginine translocase subunit TatC [Muribaculaceae bacterium]
FNKYLRHAIVELLIVAAMITPTGDPFTLFVVFLPIYMLWELSSRLVPASKPEPEE